MSRKYITVGSDYMFQYPIITHYENSVIRTELLLDTVLEHIPKGKKPVFYGIGTSGCMILMLIKQFMKYSHHTVLFNSSTSRSKHRSFIEGDIVPKPWTMGEYKRHFNRNDLYHIFIDDLISSGRTLELLYDQIWEKIYTTFEIVQMEEEEEEPFRFDLIATLSQDHNNRDQFLNSDFITIYNS